MVYGLFRDYERKLMIRRGEVIRQKESEISVSFEDGIRWTYNDEDIGKVLFYTEDEAEAAVEELGRKERWG